MNNFLAIWPHDGVAPGRPGHHWEAFSPESPLRWRTCNLLHHPRTLSEANAPFWMWEGLCMTVGWVNPPTVIPEMTILCCGCPRRKQLRPSSSDFSFPGYSPSKQANRFKTILLFFYNSALTRSSGLLRALPQELVHPCNDPVLAGGL